MWNSASTFMMRTIIFGISLVVVLGCVAGCGDNLAGPIVSVSAPQDLRAFSQNESTVALQWSAPVDADSNFQGYIVEYGSVSVELAKNQLVYIAGSLQPVETLFNVYSRKSTGDRGDGTFIRWAPAARFDSSYVLTEYAQLDPSRVSGISLGSRVSDPFTLEVNGSAGSVLDFYCAGGVDNTSPLTLNSADLFAGAFRATRFSTQSNSSPSLDLPQATFPADSTFILDSLEVSDNTIYYVRLIINNVEIHYARVHVSFVQGSAAPLRKIVIHISLQRTPGLLYAEGTEPARRYAITDRALIG